jgi:amidase
MKVRTLAIVIGIAVLLIVPLVLFACGSPVPTPPPPTQAPTKAAPTAAPTQAPPTAAPTQAPVEAAPTAAPAAQAAPNNTPRLRQLDFAPFDAALAAFTAERTAQIAAIVKEADMAQVQDAVKAGQLTYTELTLYFLSRIKKYDETLRTMVELNPDALKEAQAADRLLKDGKATSLLLGMPVTLKDNIETAAPLHTTGGSEILLNYQPKADASFVKQLRDAGAVILGKANLSEFAGGINIVPPGFSAVGGLTLNPHGDFSAGGSSSGSGAGTAAYETMVSVGSETAGSLIVPASWNGVVGMYPSKGVVDGSQVIPLIKNNDSAGPIGRNVKDVAALLGVIDTKDVDYVAGLTPDALKGVKAGFFKSDVLAQPTSDLEDTTDNATVAQIVEAALMATGATVTDVKLPSSEVLDKLNSLISVLIDGGVRHDMVPYLTAAGSPVKTLEELAAYNLQDPQVRIPKGQSEVDIALADQLMRDPEAYAQMTAGIKGALVEVLDAAFADNQVDVLVSVNNYHSAQYATANYPAITVPLGKRANGMPVGLTLIGKPGDEAKLLAYAYALEQATKLRVTPDVDQFVSEANAPARAFTYGDAWQSVSCDELAVAPAIAAKADCGYVTVPEKRGESGLALGDKTIQLGVVRLRSTDKTPGAPIFQGEGGPGAPGLLFISQEAGAAGIDMSKNNAATLADRDWVYFTQRGTKGAKPFLTCPAYDAINYNVALNGWARAEKEAEIVKALEGCRDKYAAEGVDFSAYNTDENAADVKDIAKALGYDKIIYYGISYGTWLGQFIMRNHPEILEAVILDGIAPVEFTAYNQISDFQASFQRVFEACKADAACGKFYPDLEAELSEVVARLEANPAPVVVTHSDGTTVTLKLDGFAVLNHLFGTIVGNSVEVPWTIDKLKMGDPATLALMAPSAPSPSGDSGRIMHFAVNCSDDPNASLEEFKLDALAPVFEPYAWDDAIRMVSGCKVMNVPQLPTASDQPVTSDLPVLLLNGALDPATSPAYGPMIGKSLPNSQSILFPAAGHGQTRDACAMAILSAFAKNPMAKVDTSCITPKMTFVTPVDAASSSKDGKATINMTLPVGFLQGAPGQWAFGGTGIIALNAYPAGTQALDALQTALKNVGIAYDSAQVKDAAPIAGRPVKTIQGQTELGGVKYDYDYFAFDNQAGAYVIVSLQSNPAATDTWRQQILPALLGTVVVTQ